MFVVRFHLASGPHYKWWQVKNTKTKEVAYFPPDDVVLILTNCKLINHRKTAERIFSGENKTVCSWIKCKELLLTYPSNDKESANLTSERMISYNPKVAPYWRDNDGNNIDRVEFRTIVTKGAKVYHV